MTDSSLIVRDATRDDIDGILPLLAQLYQLEEAFYFDEKRQRAGLALCFHRPDLAHLLVVERYNVVIGFANLQHSVSTFTGGMSLHIDDFVVDESARGIGVGTVLMEGVISVAKQLSVSRVTVYVDLENTLARKFYEGASFESVNLLRLQRFVVD